MPKRISLEELRQLHYVYIQECLRTANDVDVEFVNEFERQFPEFANMHNVAGVTQENLDSNYCYQCLIEEMTLTKQLNN